MSRLQHQSLLRRHTVKSVVQTLSGWLLLQLSVYDVNSSGGVQPKPRFQGTVTRQQEVLNNLCISAPPEGPLPPPYSSPYRRDLLLPAWMPPDI